MALFLLTLVVVAIFGRLTLLLSEFCARHDSVSLEVLVNEVLVERMLTNAFLVVLFRSCELAQIFSSDAVNGAVLFVNNDEDLLQHKDNVVTTVRQESVVIIPSHVDSKFHDALGRVNCFGYTINTQYGNHSFDTLLVDIIYVLACDYQGAFLCPLVHISLFDLVGKQNLLSGRGAHETD